MQDYIPTIKAPLLGLAAAVLVFLGGWDTPLRALLVLNLLDLFSGLLKGFLLSLLSSDTCAKGGIRKLLMWVVVATAVQVDLLHAQGTYARDIIIWMWCATEAVSILENAAAAGLPIPPALTQSLKKLRGMGELRFPETGEEKDHV